MKMNRREVLILGAAGAGAAALPSTVFAAEGDVFDMVKLMAPMPIPDKVFGDANAKVTLIEYLSPTCPHCARMAINVFPAFRDKYVKTGKVRFILRPFARNTLDAGIFMLAETAAKNAEAGASRTASASASSEASSEPPPPAPLPEQYSDVGAAAWEAVIDTFFKTQQVWGLSDKPLDAIKSIAFQLGFNDASFDAALKDTDLFNRVQQERDAAVKDFDISATPTFFVNGKTVMGEKTLDEMSAIVDPLL